MEGDASEFFIEIGEDNHGNILLMVQRELHINGRDCYHLCKKDE